MNYHTDGISSNDLIFRVDDHCFVCQEIIDHEGNFVAGNVDCFNLPENDLTYESTCSQEGNYCKSSLRADYTANGKIIYTFTRSCSDETEEDTCNENLDVTTGVFQIFKRCRIRTDFAKIILVI